MNMTDMDQNHHIQPTHLETALRRTVSTYCLFIMFRANTISALCEIFPVEVENTKTVTSPMSVY